jgi:quinol monooxygenase YgiN
VPDQKRTQAAKNMREEGPMSKFHWTVPLTVAACLIGAAAHADRFKEVVVVTHVDVDPQNVPIAEPLLTGFVVDSRGDPGVVSFTLITQDPTTNHFQLIEVFRDMRAFDAHVSTADTIKFRTNLQPLLGAPYDERLYRAE